MYSSTQAAKQLCGLEFFMDLELHVVVVGDRKFTYLLCGASGALRNYA